MIGNLDHMTAAQKAEADAQVAEARERQSANRYLVWEDIRRAIAEDDTEIYTVEHGADADDHVVELTDAGVDVLANIALASVQAHLVVDMLIFCPRCNVQHVDRPQPEKNWDNPPHKSHLCHACGCIWRPSDMCTNGVESIHTKGKDDNLNPSDYIPF